MLVVVRKPGGLKLHLNIFLCLKLLTRGLLSYLVWSLSTCGWGCTLSDGQHCSCQPQLQPGQRRARHCRGCQFLSWCSTKCGLCLKYPLDAHLWKKSSEPVHQMLSLPQRTTEVMDRFENHLPGTNDVPLPSGPSVAQQMLATSFHHSGKCVTAKKLFSFCGTVFCMSCKRGLHLVFKG